MAIIEAVDLTRTFITRERLGRVRRARQIVTAVDSLNFAIGEGEFVGYLGANGAGKSTTIKMCTGILRPTSGRIRVCGRDPFTERKIVAYEIGTMFGQRQQLWWDLPLSDSFDQLRLIYRVPPQAYQRRRDRLVDVLALSSFLKTPVRQLSLGQRVRGELAASMIHDPRVLFLDEPTIGLDVISRERVREFLKDANRHDNVTVLLTTHDLTDLESLCSRLIVLGEGRVVSDGPLTELFDAYGLERTMTVDLVNAREPLVIRGVRVESTDGPRQVLRFSSRETSSAAVLRAVADQADIVDLTLKEPDVEDLVRAIQRQGSTDVDS